MADTTTSAFEGLIARRALQGATSANGLVSTKLHRTRQELETKLGATLKAFDEQQRAHAKRNDRDEPVVREGLVLIPSLTPAYEIDPDKANDLVEAVKPILEEQITFSAPTFTEADAGWVVGAEGVEVGPGLSPFLVLE